MNLARGGAPLANRVVSRPFVFRLFLLVSVFCLGLIPFASHYYFVHTDEHLYTNAAMQMAATGDWLTPRDASGVPRFQKPLVTYWLIAASYRLLGVSPLSSRLPSIVFGALTLLFTYAMGLRLCGSSEAAWLATIILFCNPLFILASLRANPDVFLCFFILLSARGFCSILFEPEPLRGASEQGYAGAALGALTKGLPAILFLGYVLTFARWQGVAQRTWNSLLRVRAILLGTALICAWIAINWSARNAAFASTLWYDELTDKISIGLVSPLRILAYLSQYLLFFIPWIVIVSPVIRSRRAEAGAVETGSTKFPTFVVGWCVLLALIFGFGRTTNGHYLLPACPLIALALASYLYRQSDTRVLLFARVSLILCAFAIAILALSIPVLAGASRLHVAATVASISLLAVAVRRIRNLPILGLATRLALVLFVFFPLSSVLLSSWILPDLGVQVVTKLKQLGITTDRSILFTGPDGLAGIVRVCSGGTLQIKPMTDWDNKILTETSYVIAPEGRAPTLQSLGFKTEPAGSMIVKLSIGDLIGALNEPGDLGAYLKGKKQRFIVAYRRGQQPASN